MTTNGNGGGAGVRPNGAGRDFAAELKAALNVVTELMNEAAAAGDDYTFGNYIDDSRSH